MVQPWLMVLSQSFLECHKEVSWVLLCSSYIPAKCLNCWRTNYVYAYADDATLLEVVRKPADTPAVAAWLNMARIQEWCNHWCMIRNPNKMKALVVCKMSQRRHPYREVWQQAHFQDHMRGIVSRVSQRIGILTLVMLVFVDTYVLLRCCYTFVLPIVEYLPSASRAPGVFGGQALPWSEFL